MKLSPEESGRRLGRSDNVYLRRLERRRIKAAKRTEITNRPVSDPQIAGVSPGPTSSHSYKVPIRVGVVVWILFLLFWKVLHSGNDPSPPSTPAAAAAKDTPTRSTPTFGANTSSIPAEIEKTNKRIEELDRELASVRAKNREYDQTNLNLEAQRMSDELRSHGIGISPAEARGLIQTENDLTKR